MQKVIHLTLDAACLYLNEKHNLRLKESNQPYTFYAPAKCQCTSWEVCSASRDLTYCQNKTQRLSWHQFIYLFVSVRTDTRTAVRSQLVWDLSVFVFGMEHLVAPFCYLRNKAVFRHVCVFADEARQEKQVYVPLLHSGDPKGKCLSGFSIADGEGRILPGWRRRPSSYLCWGPACASAAGFGCDWQTYDVRGRSYSGLCLDSTGDHLPGWCHLFSKLHS